MRWALADVLQKGAHTWNSLCSALWWVLVILLVTSHTQTHTFCIPHPAGSRTTHRHHLRRSTPVTTSDWRGGRTLLHCFTCVCLHIADEWKYLTLKRQHVKASYDEHPPAAFKHIDTLLALSSEASQGSEFSRRTLWHVDRRRLETTNLLAERRPTLPQSRSWPTFIIFIIIIFNEL